MSMDDNGGFLCNSISPTVHLVEYSAVVDDILVLVEPLLICKCKPAIIGSGRRLLRLGRLVSQPQE
jgi:hypothetical protein